MVCPRIERKQFRLLLWFASRPWLSSWSSSLSSLISAPLSSSSSFIYLFSSFFFTILFIYQLQVLIVGPSGDESAERLFRESLLHKQSVLGQLVVRLDDSSLSNSFLAERRPSLEAMTSRHGKLVSGAYLCRNRSCSSTPITSVQDLHQILDQNHQPHATA